MTGAGSARLIGAGNISFICGFYHGKQRVGLRRLDRLIAGISQPLADQKPGEVTLRLCQRMAEGITQMQPLVDGRIKGEIDQLITGENMRLRYKPRADSLMHHGIEEDHIVRLEGDHRGKSGLGKKPVRDGADAVTPALQDEGRVPQVAQAYAFLPRKRMGGGEGDQQLLTHEGDVGDKLGILTRAERQIDLTAEYGVGLLARVELCQPEGDVRVAAGKLIIDFTVNDRAPVRRGADADILFLTPGDAAHGEHHAVLLVHDFFGVFQHLTPQRGRHQAASAAQKEGRAAEAFPFAHNLAECRLGNAQRQSGLGKASALGDREQIVQLSRVHHTGPL